MPHFAASFNTRTSGRVAECSNVSVLVPAEQYVTTDWFQQRFRIVDPTVDVFDKVSVLQLWTALNDRTI